MKELIKELVHELGLMPIQELENFREELMNELSQKQMPEIVIDFCGYAVDLVIVKKAEKEGMTV